MVFVSVISFLRGSRKSFYFLERCLSICSDTPFPIRLWLCWRFDSARNLALLLRASFSKNSPTTSASRQKRIATPCALFGMQSQNFLLLCISWVTVCAETKCFEIKSLKKKKKKKSSHSMPRESWVHS